MTALLPSADACAVWGVQLSVWGSEEWERRKTRSIARGNSPASLDTRIQFHNDQRRLLVANETLVAIYDMAKWERNKQVC